MDPPSNSAKAKAWARARARVETRPRANARARVRDRIRARATELGLEGGNNFRGVQIKRDSSSFHTKSMGKIIADSAKTHHT